MGPPRRATLCHASQTFYELLDVPRGADSKAIKKAFKKMALKYHPDVNKEVKFLCLFTPKLARITPHLALLPSSMVNVL